MGRVLLFMAWVVLLIAATLVISIIVVPPLSWRNIGSSYHEVEHLTIYAACIAPIAGISLGLLSWKVTRQERTTRWLYAAPFLLAITLWLLLATFVVYASQVE